MTAHLTPARRVVRFVLSTMTALAAACRQPQAAPQVMREPPMTVTEVATMPASEVVLPRTLEVTGALRADAQVDLAAEIDGRVLAASFERGRAVRAGELLVQLDAEDATNRLAEAEALAAFGRRWGSAAMFEQARLANENPPRLRTFDAQGHRCDLVEFHPAYHYFMAESIAAGLHASTWRADATPAPAPADVARAAAAAMVSASGLKFPGRWPCAIASGVQPYLFV